jgi:hypothetical protein
MGYINKMTKNNKNKHICKTRCNTFTLQKCIYGKRVYIGSFNTLDEAIKVRDELNKLGWTKKAIKLYRKKYNQQNPKLNKTRYINPYGNEYCIQKTVDKELLYFGRYKTLEDAIKVRDYLEKYGWSKNISTNFKCSLEGTRIKRDLPKYIAYAGDKYIIKKYINDKTCYYGSYSTLTEAINKVKQLEENNWVL